MRCNWQRWLWGLIPLILMSLAAIYVERDRIQGDLTGRAKAALAKDESQWASISIEGRDVVLTGRATQDSDPDRAARSIRNLWGVRRVDNRATLPPVVEPFVWSARRRGGRLRLAGYVPDRATRQALLGLTKGAMPDVEVTDRLRTARGVKSPDTWLAGLSFALKQLSLLKNGDARLEDLALTISGEAEDSAAFKTVNTALKSGLPKGITLAAANIAAPVVSPYTWSAQFAGGQLVLAGNVAGGEKIRQNLLAAAKAAAPGADTVDRMDPAEGAPQRWAEVAAALLHELARLESGSAEMKDAAVTVGGMAQDEAQAKAIRSSLRATIPPNFTLVDQIRVREAKAPEPAPPSPPTASERDALPSASLVSPPMANEEASREPGATAPERSEPAGKAQSDTAAPAPVQPAPAPVQQAAPAAPPPSEPERQAAAPEATAPVKPDTAPVQQAAPAPVMPNEPQRQAAAPEATAPVQPDTPPVQQAAPAPVMPNEPQRQAATPEPASPVKPDTAPVQQAAPAPSASNEPAQHAAAPEPGQGSRPTGASEQPASAPLPPEKTVKKQTASTPPAPVEPAPSQTASPSTASTPAQSSAGVETAAAQAPDAQPRSPQETRCQQELNNITNAGHIHFATDSAKLDSASFETLDRLAAAAKACPGVRIAIEGHTDAEGRSGYNQRLSVRRAKAVVTYLIKAGADRKQFVTVGYGPTKPAAPNDTEENMAKNRRIEFSVQPR